MIYKIQDTTKFIERQNREEQIGGTGTEWLDSESWPEKMLFKMTLKCTEIVDRANMCILIDCFNEFNFSLPGSSKNKASELVYLDCPGIRPVKELTWVVWEQGS